MKQPQATSTMQAVYVMKKTVDGETINHVWDGSKQIVADVVDNQFYEADCYIRGTNLVAKYNYWNGNKSEYTYYTQNAHGDVVNLTDSTGAVVKSYTYDAFGVEKRILMILILSASPITGGLTTQTTIKTTYTSAYTQEELAALQKKDQGFFSSIGSSILSFFKK